MRSKFQIAVLLVSFLLIVFVPALVFLDIPYKTVFFDTFQNSLHTVVFFVLMLGAIYINEKYALLNFLKYPYFGLLIFLFAFGLLIEVLQTLTGRGFGISDLLRNGGGAAAAYLVFKGCKTKNVTIIRRINYLALSLLILILCFFKVMLAITEIVSRPSVPLLENFENRASYLRFSDAYTNLARVVKSPADWVENNTKVLKIHKGKRARSRIRFLEVQKDWSDYSRFSFELFIPSEELDPEISLTSTVLIRDIVYKRKNNLEHQIIEKYNVKPGANIVSVNLPSTVLNKNKESINFYYDHVFEIIIQIRGFSKPSVVYVDNMRLD